MVVGGGFEPPKASPTDLQSVPFDHSGTPPYDQLLTLEPAEGLEPPAHWLQISSSTNWATLANNTLKERTNHRPRKWLDQQAWFKRCLLYPKFNFFKQNLSDSPKIYDDPPFSDKCPAAFQSNYRLLQWRHIRFTNGAIMKGLDLILERSFRPVF